MRTIVMKAGAWMVVLATPALAANIGVVPKKLIVVDKLTAASKAKTVYVSKDKTAGITKGSGTDPAQISVQFDWAYESGATSGAFSLPLGASNGTAGWLVNKEKVAKYVNKAAPAGATQAKVGVVKPDKLLKLVGKGLGDTAADILGGGDPNPGKVYTAYCVTNGGEENCHCSEFSGCVYKLIAGNTGAKLVCKTGAVDVACSAIAPSTTTTVAPPTTTTTIESSTTTTSLTTTTTTTFPPNVCCDFGGFCGGGIDAIACVDEGGVPTENAICDVSGDCVSPPGTGGCCCELPTPSFPYACAVLDLSAFDCASQGCGEWFGDVCLPDGSCQPPGGVTTSTTTTTPPSSTTTTTLNPCYTDTGLTVIDACAGLEWEKKNTVFGSGLDAGNLHDVDNKYSWAGECTISGALCQPNAAAAATCATQTGGANGCAECGGGEGTCDVDPTPGGAITTIWDWVNQVNGASFAGHTDWRPATSAGSVSSPTGEPAELESLVDLGAAGCDGGGGSAPCIDPIFGPTAFGFTFGYWSGSSDGSNSAWGVEFWFGGVGTDNKDLPRNVRAVRGGVSPTTTSTTISCKASGVSCNNSLECCSGVCAPIFNVCA